MNFRKRFFLLVGSTSILMIAGLIVLVGLVMGGLLLSYLVSQPDSTDYRRPRRTLVYVTFPPTSTPTAISAPIADQSMLPPADTSASTPADISLSAPLSTDTTAPPVANLSSANNTENVSPVSANSAPDILAPATTTPTLSSLAAGTSTSTLTPTETSTSTPTPTETSTSTPTPTETLIPTPAPGQITGRILLAGSPVGGVTLKLEDQAFNPIAETSVGVDGVYTFPDLAASSEGYTLLFAQEWNPQYGMDQVISWGWLGPVAVENGAVVELPDLDISLLGFGQTSPAPNASFSAGAISSGNPIVFEWTAYPEATAYWVDLAQEEGQAPVWSAASQTTSLAFDGTLDDGAQIQPGEYWWGVGARRDLGSYTLVVYGYLPVLTIKP